MISKKLIIILLLISILKINFAQIVFIEDFEVTNTNNWVYSSSGGLRGLTTTDYVSENHSFIIKNQNGLYNGISNDFNYCIFPNYISFYVKTNMNMGGNFVLTDSNNSPIIYFKADSNMIGIQGRNGYHCISYDTTKWQFIEIKNINYSDKTFSLKINNQHIADSIKMINNSYFSVLHLSNCNNNAIAKWDNIFMGYRGTSLYCTTPIVNNQNICHGDTAHLFSINTENTIWWDAQNNGNIICYNDSLTSASNITTYAENQCYLENLELHSSYNGNSNTNSIIFEIYPDIDTKLNTICLNSDAQNDEIKIYYRQGISEHHQNSLNNWTLLKIDTITAVYGDKTYIDIDQLFLEKNKVYSFLIIDDDANLFINNLTRNRTISDGNCIIKTTYTGDAQLVYMQNNAMFNGGIKYSVAAEKADSIIGNHTANYLSNSYSKGMCFIAPCDMIITGVRTPGANLNQTVEVVKFLNGLPPFNPLNTNRFTSELFANVNHNSFIDCKINLRAGEGVAFFGKSNNFSSIGDTSRHIKSINGFPTTIYSCNSDSQLSANMQLQNLYRTYTGNYCKMDFKYILPSSEFESNRSQAQINVIVCNSLNEIDNDMIRIYPNPTEQILYIEFEEENIKSRVEFYNINSQLVKAADIYNRISNINLSELNNGQYIIYLYTEDGTYRYRLIVNR